jgi:site-specific recombinase XerD
VLWRDDGKPGEPLPKLERPLLSKWMARAQRRAGLRDNGGLHILRHTFCSHLVLRGAPINVVRDLAGHRKVETTIRYLHLAEGDKQNAIRLLDGGAAVSTGELTESSGLRSSRTE